MSPHIKPDNNPVYPKRITQLKNLNGANKIGTTHFTQLSAIPQPLQDKAKKKGADKDQRLIITQLEEPLEATKRLEGAPQGTFFYMQSASILQNLICKQLGIIDFDAQLAIQNIEKLMQVVFQPEMGPNEEQKKQFQFSRADIELLCQKQSYDLLVCPHTYITLNDYYTLSSLGITHISKEQQSFTKLEEWTTELIKLQKLRQIPVIKNFRLWKPLKLLKKAVKQNRQQYASQYLTKNLFNINKYLKFSLSVTLNCTNGIRSMNIIVTQKEFDEIQNLKAILRKQRNKAAGIRHKTVSDPELIKLQNFIDAPYKYILKMFDNFNERKQIKTFEEVENETAQMDNETQLQEEGEGAYNPYGQEKLFKYPFTVEEFDQLTEDRCRDMSMLFDQLMTSMLICIKYMTNQVITQSFGQKSDNSDERTIKTTITSYTERAARLNMCKRLHSYLRLTDFMIMDSLYDFQYAQLKRVYTRIYEASQFELPAVEQVVASQEELLERERIGMYLFDGKEAEAANDEEEGSGDENQQDLLDDGVKIISVGNDTRNLFLGFIRCQLQQKEPSQGCHDLRTEEDPQTPGDQIMPGQSAQIQLFPTGDDFYQSFDNFNESLLSILDCIKRLTNHEDFAEITLPIFTNTDATFEHIDDQNKLLALQEINVPTLQVLFANNPAFRVLVNNIKTEIYSQYEKATVWSKTLQPFYDAFNQCMNLNIDKIEEKYFKIPLSAYNGKDLVNPDPKWLEAFEKIMGSSIYMDKNDYSAVLDEYLTIDIKDTATQAEAFINLVINSKNDIPFCTKSGLNKNTIADQLFSDEEFDDLLKQMEHNRRLHYSMPQEIHLGLYTFSCQDLKASFLPVAQRCLNFLRAIVPVAVIKRLMVMFINMLGLKKYLSKNHESIEEFILFREVVQLLSDEVIDTMKAFQSNIIQFLAMFEQHGMKIQPQVNNFLQFFNQQFDLFKNQVIAAEQTLEGRTSKWLEVQAQACQECQAELEKLKMKMRLRTLNSPVELFTMGEISAFMYDYETKTREIRRENEQLKIQLENAQNEKAKLEASKLDMTAVDEKILDLTDKILPDYMVVQQTELTCEIIKQQHKFYVTKEYEEEEVEEPEAYDDEKEIKDEEKEDDAAPAESENVTTTEPEKQEKQEQEPNKEEEQINPEEEEINYVPEKTLHARISKALVQIDFKVTKTQQIKQELDVVEDRIKQVRGYQQSLSAEPTEFALLETVGGAIKQFYNLWIYCRTWYEQLIIYSRQNFLGDLNQQNLVTLVNDTSKASFQCERFLPNSEMPLVLKQRVQEVRQLVPIVQSLDNTSLREYHWKNVSDILKASIPMAEIKIKKEIAGQDENETEAPANADENQTEVADNTENVTEATNQPKQDENSNKKYEIVVVNKPQVNIIWLVKNNAMLFKDQLSQISSNAANEASLEKQFTKIDNEWQNVKLKTTNYKDSTDIYVLKDSNDVIMKLQDTILVVSGIACSRYVGELKETVEGLFDRLKQLDVVLDLLLKVQKGYLYLLNIFSSSDIQRQLQAEFQLFNSLDEFWKNLMQHIQFYPQALKVTTAEIVKPKDESQLTGLSLKPSVLEKQLKYFELLIDQIQKSLDNYLQSKRMAFPRLFFISDDELLDLLAQAKNPYQLQTHMRKLFENVAQMEIVNNVQAGGLEIVSLMSEEGEKLQLVGSVKPRGTVTTWLKALEQKMRQSVAKELKQALDGYQNYQSRNQWILNNLGQCIIAGSQVFWCSYITEAIDGRSDLSEAGYGRLKGEASIFKDMGQGGSRKTSPLKLYFDKFEADLQNLIILIKSNLTKLQRGAITALATIETHSRDTISELIACRNLNSTDDFNFQKLQRYYYNPVEIEYPVYIRQNTTTMPYQNEYLGASPRLVITPLTDLVYLHIAVSVQNCKAINLAGPAGTGKSETTKDQNKSRANACVVFNCSDTVEIQVMNRFFMGFCMTGAGSCLDEFNRLELSLLSVIAGSIKQILDGLRYIRSDPDASHNFLFNGYELQLHPDTMIAISLNPGYAGRAELPQNLKNLFRSFSMVVPDYSLISEIILFSQGFTTAKPLSRKVVQLYKLSSEQLSQQNSYDFGMRGVKSVLSMAGNFRRKFPDQSEEFLLIRAMQDSNLPRMPAEDRDLFMGIVQDLFPNVVYKQTPNDDFIRCILKSIEQNNYQVNQGLITKINQVFETCQIRHGVLLMGPAKTGKSICLKTLTEALGFLRELVEAEFPPEKKKVFDSNYPYNVVNPVDVHLINSKAITLNELYGSYDENSGEWRDGLMGAIARTALERTAEQNINTHKQFILFDSHVSTEWIETMNSLLDDSKLLCLANSERLKINDFINIVFECENLTHASPATVSRLGIINYPECKLEDTLKLCSLQMRPANGYKNMTEDEIQANENKILLAAVTSALEQSIVRWDHLIISWIDNKLDDILMFKQLKRNIKKYTGEKIGIQQTIEAKIYTNLKGLILRLFRQFVPHGLKFFYQKAVFVLPSNEIQLVRQIMDIFTALLSFNRSLSVKQQMLKQQELQRIADENGLSEVQQAQDVTSTIPVDVALICKFLITQYLARNQQQLSKLPDNVQFYAMMEEYIFNSEEYLAVELMIKNVFMFAFIWSFGGICAAGNKQAREEFDNLVRYIIELTNDEYSANKASDEFQLQKVAPFEDYVDIMPRLIQLPLIPNVGSVFDYYIDWQKIVDLQNNIAEHLTFLSIGSYIKEAVEDYKTIKNENNFVIFGTIDYLEQLPNVVSLITSGNMTEEQQLLLNTAILKQENIEFTTFIDLLKPFQFNPKIAFFQLFIETNDTLRYQHLMESLLKSQYNVLLTGQSGSGKTSTVANMLASLDKRQITQNIQINFSARTTSLRVQQVIEDQLIQKGKTYLPQIGRQGIIYVDDLNMPAKDQYECSQPIEFVRFFMDTKGFYDRKDLFWKTVENTCILSSCAQPGGGRETLTTRLTTSFVMFAQPEAEDEGLLKIYNTILEGYLAYPDNKYPKDIIQSSAGVVKALIQIYHNLASILKPTPSKLHYSFNLRDVSKVIQGLMRGSSKILKTSEEFVRLFIHEVMRVFADRTVNAFDNEQVCKCVQEVLNTCPGTGMKKQLVYEQLFEDDGTPKQFDDAPPANAEFTEIWGNYMRFGTPLEERVYEAKELKQVQSTVYQYLDQYNTESGKQKMNLVLFNDAIMYVSKIARILSSERGNLLNVGVGGSGRKSLTRLAAHICEYSVESIQLKKGYSQNDFHEDVKALYLRCGLKNENIVFLLDESQLVSGAILEDVNNILNSGLISNLFDQKDMETIINTTRTAINEQGLADEVNTNNRASIYNFFIDKVRDKLHLVLCLSPSGDEFRARLRTYPSLLTCTSIVWFHPWPRQALLDVSKKILTENLMTVDFSALTGPDASDEAKAKYAKALAQKLAPVATEIHYNTEKLLTNYAKETNRRHYLPPATFLDLLTIYSNLLNNRIKEISTRLNQYKTGVQRLIDAKSQVEVLQKQQEGLKPELEQKTVATDQLIEQIKVETVSVNQLRQKAMEDAALVAAQTKDCQMIAAEADRDVKACEPIIQEATKAVESIDAGMIAEMKTVKVPTPLVFLTMQSVAALMGCKQDWPSCVSMMADSKFLNSLKEYDKNNIPDKVLKTLSQYTTKKEYDIAAIEKVSVACKSLAVWVLAIEKYATIYREVEPKRQRLAQANEELGQKQAALKAKQDNLAKVEAEFQQLQDKFNKSNSEKQALQDQMDLTVARLSRAEQLTGALGDERVRWIQQSEELQELMTMVVGDVFLASCGVGYFGVFNRQYRDQLMTYWHGLLEIYSIKTQPLDQIKLKGLFGLISSDGIIIENWKDCDLPNDMQSIDNAVIMDQIIANKWPLFIDPQNQASNFIKKLYAGKIKILKPTQAGLVHIFEQSIHDGDIVLLDGIGEKLDPILQPIIEKQYVTLPNGTNLVNMGGDQPIEVHPDFKMYLTTKLQNPRYSPETHAKLQIINFSISVDALEQQILSDVIQLEYPQLEQTRVELTKEESENKKKLMKLADAILYNLSNFEGSVLDNEPLIQVLNESKQVSQTIKEKEVESAATKKEIKKYYSYYKPIGVRTTILYFLISDMSMVESMYLFALGYFKQIVLQEIKKVDDFRGDADKIPERVQIIIDKITFNLFNSISRGLFEKDKQIFAMLLGIRIKQRIGDIKPEEWGIFVKSKVYADIYLSDPLNLQGKDSAKTLIAQIDKCETIDKGKLQSVLYTMAYVSFLNPLAMLIINNIHNITQILDENKHEQTQIINYVISMNKEHLGSVKDDVKDNIIKIMESQQTTAFQRLILLKFIADEYFYIATPQFIEQMIDSRYASIKPQSIRQLYNDSTQYSPILFIISEGVDPVAQTQQLASEINKVVQIISLGKGQTEIVRKEMARATMEGKWVFLQNVHLASSDFLPELEQIVEVLGIQGGQSPLKYIHTPLHQDFRLFLSSTPVSTFPQSVLQASLKCTTEPPLSMKKNILRQVGMLENDKFEFNHLKDKIPEYMNANGVIGTWKRIVYSLIYFHSQVLERKKFGPQGYNLNYDFNDTDLEICILTLEDFFIKIFKQEQEQQFTDAYINLDWDAIKFIFSKIHYSGKVNDSWDKRCVKTLLTTVINNNIVKCQDPRNEDSMLDYTYVEGDNKYYTLSFVNFKTTLEDVLAHAQELPSIDSTKVFGMSSNSDIVNQQAETSRILNRVLGVSPDCLEKLIEEAENEGAEQTEQQVKQADSKKSQDDDPTARMSGAEKAAMLKQKVAELNLKVFGEEVKTKTQDEIVKDITDQLLAKLPATMSINDACQASMRYDENNVPLCMTTILKQEMERFNGLLTFIKDSLTNVALAIKGDVILSQDLEEQYQALYIGKVPGAWSKIAYPSLKPLAGWFDDLILRVKFMRRWLTEGPPKSYWISGQYFPQGFITALLQTHARKYKKSIDSLSFKFEFTNIEWEDWQGLNIEENEPDGTAVWIHGLYLDCAFFDLNQMKLLEAKEGLLYPKLPYVRFIPTDVPQEKAGTYRCPVYKTSQRAGVLSSTGHSTNFILPLLVPTDHEKRFFVRLGTCALCQLDD